MLKLVHAMDMEFQNLKNYYDSFGGDKIDLNCYAIAQVENGPQKYFDYFINSELNLYYLVKDENPNYIIGFGTIEDSEILNYHKDYLNTGNIGYGIRPTERKKGYGTILLGLLLLECKKFGMHEVCVSCLKENIASSEVIKKNKGKLKKEFLDDETEKYGQKFWIKLHPKVSCRTKRLVKRTKNVISNWISELW